MDEIFSLASSQRKSQMLNPARAQMVIRYIINEHVLKLTQQLIGKVLRNKLQLINNMDEKCCRLRFITNNK